MSQDYNKIITTVNSITNDYTFLPDISNLIVIDTSNNRIGINTENPSYSIHIADSGQREDYTSAIKTPNLYVDNITMLNDLSINGKVYINTFKDIVVRGIDTSFQIADGRTVTVTNGLITDITSLNSN